MAFFNERLGEILVLAISIILFLIATILYVRVNGNELVSYYSFIYYFYIAFGIIGAYAVYFGYFDASYFVSPISEKIKVKEYGLLSLNYGLFGIFLGASFVSVFVRKSIYKKYLATEIYSRPKKETMNTVLFVSMFLLSVFYYIYITHPSPMLMAIQGYSPTEVALRRIEVTKDFQGVGIFSTLAITLSFIFPYYLFARTLAEKTWFSKYLFLAILLVSVLVLTLDGQKATIIFMLLGFLYVYRLCGGEIKFFGIFVLLAIILITLGFLYVVVMGTDLDNQLFALVLERIFGAQAVAAFLVFDFYSPNNFIFFNSMTGSIFKLLVSHPVPRSSELLMEIYYPGLKEIGGWNVNGIFVHEAYSNFGWGGILIGSIYVGIANAILCNFFLSIKKTPLNISFFVYFSISFASILTSFNDQIINTRSILIFLLFLTFVIFNKIAIRKKICH